MDKEYQQACTDMLRLLDVFKLTTARLADAHNLTRVQLFVLYRLAEQGEMAMGGIAGALHCDASNVTGIVDRLVAGDLISRHELASDRRTKTLRLTAKGQQTVAALKADLPKMLGCDKLTGNDVACLHDIAQKLSA